MKPVTRSRSVPLSPPIETFDFDGHSLAYREFGTGDRTVILIHGLLLPQRMHEPLAQALAARGHRVITQDLLGHGWSDRSTSMWEHSMAAYARQVIALMDHLGMGRAVVGGTSLGANVTLEVASLAPSRLAGMVIEMPVLDNALLACAGVFGPLLFALTALRPLATPFSRAVRALPRPPLSPLLDSVLDALSQPPEPASAVLQGLFFGRVAPHRDERCTFTAPALVIGHHRDPIHPFSDAGMLAAELPRGRLQEVDTILDLRLHPERYVQVVGDFLDECWGARRRTRGRAAS